MLENDPFLKDYFEQDEQYVVIDGNDFEQQCVQAQIISEGLGKSVNVSTGKGNDLNIRTNS